jgi:hypothetical protein
MMKLSSSKLSVVYPTKDELKKALISVGVGLALSGCGAVNPPHKTKPDTLKKESVQEDIESGQVTGGVPPIPEGVYIKDDTKK